MAEIQIGDKGMIRCEVRGFGKPGPKLHLPRSICVAARGHMVWILETEFVPETPDAESQVEVEKLPPNDP